MSKLTVAASLIALAFSSLALAAEPPANAAEIVKNANWNEMETLTIELKEHEFAPKDLKLKANKPYKLVIKNIGERDHYYTAAEFYKSVAWRKVQTPRPSGGELKAPYFSAVEVFKKGGSVELFLVPVAKGTYEVICTIDDHKDKGMTGSITVE